LEGCFFSSAGKTGKAVFRDAREAINASQPFGRLKYDLGATSARLPAIVRTSTVRVSAAAIPHYLPGCQARGESIL
jgi:hypothetical protein